MTFVSRYFAGTLLGLVLTAGLPAASTEAASHDFAPSAFLPRGQARALPIDGLVVGGLRLRLGVTTLDRIAAQMGDGHLRYNPRTGRHALCYTIPAPRGPQTLWFVSRDGPDNVSLVLSEIQALDSPGPIPRLDCPIPQASVRPLFFAPGIWLGETRHMLIDRLGEPSATRGTTLLFVFDAPLAGQPAPEHSVGLVRAELRDGSVVALTAAERVTQ